MDESNKTHHLAQIAESPQAGELRGFDGFIFGVARLTRGILGDLQPS